jgi:hypothetical protein
MQGTQFETRFHGHIRSEELVEVSIDATGAPVSVVVTQRLTITGKGDYAFTIPVPARDVVAAPGSEAQPGLRESGVVWQGFSRGRRVLAARIMVRLDAASRALPLRLVVEKAASKTGIRLVGRGTPLRVRGAVSVAGSPGVQLSALLDDGALERTIALPGTGAPKIAVDAEPVGEAPFLANPDPRGSSSTSYRYATARAHSVAVPGHSDDGTSALTVGLALLAGIAVAIGAAVLWARL